MSTIGKAIAIAAQAHQDQLDKGAGPYVLHPIRMMLRLPTKAEQIAAVLHDVVEDTPWRLADLQAAGFSPEVLAAVDGLTQREDEDYEPYYRRVQANPIALRVKLADLQDNMDLTRLRALGIQDWVRIERYHRYWRELNACLSNTHTSKP